MVVDCPVALRPEGGSGVDVIVEEQGWHWDSLSVFLRSSIPTWFSPAVTLPALLSPLHNRYIQLLPLSHTHTHTHHQDQQNITCTLPFSFLATNTQSPTHLVLKQSEVFASTASTKNGSRVSTTGSCSFSFSCNVITWFTPPPPPPLPVAYTEGSSGLKWWFPDGIVDLIREYYSNTRGTHYVLQPRQTNEVTTLLFTLHDRPIS